MSLWIKICGNTSLDDALLAADAGADAVGFVFAPSPRQVATAEVAGIVPHLPPAIEKIGVFVDAGLDQISQTVRNCGLTGVQLHFDAASDLPAKLRIEFGPSLRILRVVHFEAGGGKQIAEQIMRHAANPHVDGVLVDSRTASTVGGTGKSFDWAEACRTVFSESEKLKLIAAGGLNPGNVAHAIATLHPWGVDVVSGVEASPGRKHAVKVKEFAAAARAASATLALEHSPDQFDAL
jgi:phosphoribosylanthranilate isomerase